MFIMNPTETLLLTRNNVADLLSLEECINTVEEAFRLYAEGKVQQPKILGVHNQKGGFHIKAGLIEKQGSFFAAKMNANFPGNMKEYGLPTIQGVLVACDGQTGQLSALVFLMAILCSFDISNNCLLAELIAFGDSEAGRLVPVRSDRLMLLIFFPMTPAATIRRKTAIIPGLNRSASTCTGRKAGLWES